jgi:membrane-bound inhibitor of C-type lysozyme
MIWRRAAIGGVMALVSVFVTFTSPASAQTFEGYRCADGTRFILAFYPSDKRAYVQIDGHPVVLRKSLTSLSGRRYSGGGVHLVLTGSGATIRHLRRPVTACELSAS